MNKLECESMTQLYYVDASLTSVHVWHVQFGHPCCMQARPDMNCKSVDSNDHASHNLNSLKALYEGL